MNDLRFQARLTLWFVLACWPLLLGAAAALVVWRRR